MPHSIAAIAAQHLEDFKARYGKDLSTDQWSALNAILGCRTEQYGALSVACSECEWGGLRFKSCGHRSCSQCQNHATTEWLQRQTRKLLPLEYFMATFTLPRELRALAKSNQKVVYKLLFECAVSTLQTFGLNDETLKAKLAMTGVLHTHNRCLDYHPHVHLIIPGGGVQVRQKNKTKHRTWKAVKGEYLFNHFNLAKVFRGKLIAALKQAGLKVPPTPKNWVADCKHVGSGLPALKYLSRYLYRGVIRDKQIVKISKTHVTFSYTDSKTNKAAYRKMLAIDFLYLILQHVLPKGFRRARDYGFLHGNAKHLLKIVQWALQVMLPMPEDKERPAFKCPKCSAPVWITQFHKPGFSPG